MALGSLQRLGSLGAIIYYFFTEGIEAWVADGLWLSVQEQVVQW
jgi:hypothetical protein